MNPDTRRARRSEAERGPRVRGAGLGVAPMSFLCARLMSAMASVAVIVPTGPARGLRASCRGRAPCLARGTYTGTFSCSPVTCVPTPRASSQGHLLGTGHCASGGCSGVKGIQICVD